MPKQTASRKSRAGSSARMRDVANRAGVSTMTVSRALNEPSKVSEAVRERVLKVVKEIGYLPNHLASSLSSNRSTTIGLILPSIDNSIFTQTVKGLSDVIRQSGFQLMIAECGYDPNEEEELITAFLGHRVSGLVLHSTEHTPQAIAKIRKSGVPVVENGNIPAEPLDMVVSYSNRNAAYAMTSHLARLGYKNIAYASLYSVHNDRSRDRLDGYMQALEEFGLEPDQRLTIETNRGLNAGAEAVARIVQNAPEVDALFCAGDVLAVGALFECQKRGWAVPERIALASFDDVDLLRHVSPSVTTIRLPRHEIGERTAQMLLSRIIDGAEHLRGSIVDLKYEVIQREST
ncbi:MAG: LacI family DNA-binding transcriptional regulator [Hyphomicrobiaceae bacterium]|nr:LacI family DNA-binding transcriptional regulator [Hyphomicrobiaceae bacterium]MCC0025255.1 LacI family DNA-binding transcriptional regulator [Hyphomicrobiaceae bacterium]